MPEPKSVVSGQLVGRAAGVLLHPTSLPGPHGIGDMGQGARDFVDWLANATVKVWQVLPLGPTGGGDSPYASPAALAGNPWLIDLAQLVQGGLLRESELAGPHFDPTLVAFGPMIGFKRDRLHLAADRLLADKKHPWYAPLQAFRAQQGWVLDAALFQVLRERRNYRPWWTWEPPLRDRNAAALQQVREQERADVDRYIVLQFFFDQQWRLLRQYARERQVELLGDVPIYVDADSADTWTHRGLFQLEPDGRPTAVAGVPPDYFSEDGQLWGNPLYDWGAMARTGFRWWSTRLRRALELVDRVRIDHFRGFAAYWSVPWGAENARGGHWEPGPGLPLFAALERDLQGLPLVAEDLGDVDDAVVALREAAGLPGMLVLQFAWGDDARNPFLPHNHVPNAVVYTGTHDNDTTLGWWRSTPQSKDRVEAWTGQPLLADVPWTMIRMAMQSVARLAVVPVQDILELGSEARMNTPGQPEKNWTWRLLPGQLGPTHAKRLAALIAVTGR